MTQARLDSAVARATGESLQTIQRRGFSPLPSRSRRFRCQAYQRSDRAPALAQHDRKEDVGPK